MATSGVNGHVVGRNLFFRQF